MERKDVFIGFEIGRILTKIVREEPLTVNEHSTLDSWIKKDENNRIYFNNLKNESQLTTSIKQLYQTDSNQQFYLIEQKIRKNKKVKLIRSISIAAGLITILSTGLWFFYNNTENNTIETTLVSNDVLPGSNKATITFSDGKAIELKDVDGIKISSRGITYTDGHEVSSSENHNSAILKTPRGGQYQITLSDGTKVWLNAGSSLEYPMKFTANREVKLNGEAYFEVYHDPKHPFIVKTDIQQIKVLGTIFNIRAYENNQYTTLVQGSVEVKANGSTSTRKMKPNEQAIINNYSLSIQKVDAMEFVAWKEGLISSSSISLVDLSQEIERWYDVDFKFLPNFRNEESAYLTINKNEKLSSVLKVIEKTYGVKATIQGKEVLIR
ncbi:FecR domain-containing protein [Chryseobacterium sp. 2987]|uniref:FecR family protein n=1 Tax=Chryseobacterium sp. 2987 TaxID=2817767 RepID=UPI0028621736|nr:FecR domain-containing protein [Chryseobacterium sp. 2987]MDR6919492.1 hypothetical protein [Chryseobacterium sp. 2987]